ncbi:MAG: hypothetical protein ACYS47_15090, partial [Planctomycetota bacterium]
MDAKCARFSLLLAALAVAVLAGCPADETTTIIYQIPSIPSNFPGTPASASNLAEDAKALSPGGQDTTAVRVFWDGHDSHHAIVLFETRIFVFEYNDTQIRGGPPPTNTTTTVKNYTRHLWASYFNGVRLSIPVEIVGKNMDLLGQTAYSVTTHRNTLEVLDETWVIPWRNLTDT